ncbi:hypothetical protein EK21DRAFT_97593 [Setomelanomma holmii]|uniref:Exosome complex protein n=1 Tax=Setomelanomma holmii TaxID=210430 RepID=A0A9P4LP22_9PLEO|nr:hypothetical protein EK21DRAFT_97593 [Setomelanomma holmii]
MDPQTDLPDLVEDLEVNIDELSETLSPLLATSLSTAASSLPLLDKAKLYVLAAYSVESLLYSTLQASGVNAKEHAIFKELARLKGYFAKIKQAEERMTVLTVPKAKLDVGAAARFIRHGLAGNDKYDLQRAERMAKEKARAQLKARQINKKFEDNGEEKAASVTPQKRLVEDVEAPQPQAQAQPQAEPALQSDQEDEEVLEGLEEPEAASVVEQPAAKKPKLPDSEPMDIDKPKRKTRGRKKKAFKSTDASEAEAEPQSPVTTEPAPSTTEEDTASAPTTQDSTDLTTPTSTTKPTRTTRSRKSKIALDEAEATSKDIDVPARAPKTRSERFKGLLDGSVPEKAKKGRGRPKKAN